jgi:hypothetical protein
MEATQKVLDMFSSLKDKSGKKFGLKYDLAADSESKSERMFKEKVL